MGEQTNQQKSPRGRLRRPCFLYLSDYAKETVDRARGHESFSSYAAQALLERAQRDGCVVYGEMCGGACARAAPWRQECSSGLPASYWNPNQFAWYCEPCAAKVNQYVPGLCVFRPIASSGAVPGAVPPPPPIPPPAASAAPGGSRDPILDPRAARLRDLAERLRRVPAAHGVDDGDVALCEEVVSVLRAVPDPDPDSEPFIPVEVDR